MSGKEDQGLLAANVLQKARSFRDDIKQKLRRSPSSNRDSRASVASSGSRTSTSSLPHKSPKSQKRVAKISRGSSFKEESNKDKQITKTDMERLETERKKVDHSLLGLKVVVDGGWTHMLHGSATVVLESVMEFKQLVESLLRSEAENSLLQSAYRGVNACLASLIKWADQALLFGESSLDKPGAEGVIKDVDTGVKELHSVALDLLKNKCNKSPGAATRKRNSLEGGIQNSPLPLTPKEKQRLEQNTHFPFDTPAGLDSTDGAGSAPPPKPPLPRNNQALISQSIQRAMHTQHQAGSQVQSPSRDGPPLPPKKRTPSVASIYDNHMPEVDSPPKSPPFSNYATRSIEQSPTHLPSQYLQRTGAMSPSPQMSPTISTASSDGTILSPRHSPHHFVKNSSGSISIPIHLSSSESSMANRASTQQMSIQQNQNARISSERISSVSSTSTRSSSFSLTKSASATSRTIMCPTDATISEVSAASAGSASMQQTVHMDENSTLTSSGAFVLSASKQEEISHLSASRMVIKNGDRIEHASSMVNNSSVQASQNLSATSLTAPSPDDMRLSQYDNFGEKDNDFDKIIRTHQNEQFQNLADQIKQLTVGVEDLQNQLSVEVDSNKPPLPNKTLKTSNSSNMDGFTERTRQRFVNRQNLVSQYDNFSSSSQSSQESLVKSVSKHQQRSRAATATTCTALEQQHAQPVVMRSSRSAVQFASHATVHQEGSSYSQQSQHRSQVAIQSSHTFSGATTLGDHSNGLNVYMDPPPLPPKRKNVESYMQIMGGAACAPSMSDFARQSMHAMAHYQSVWMQHQLELIPELSFKNPWAEPPSDWMKTSMWAGHQQRALANRGQVLSIMSEASSGRGSDVFGSEDGGASTPPFPPKLPAKKTLSDQSSFGSMSPAPSPKHHQDQRASPALPIITFPDEDPPSPITSIESPRQSSTGDPGEKKMDSGFEELSVLDDTNVADQLIRSKPGSEEPEIRGGSVNALIVHASSVGVKDILYQEAFLTTYRTFIKPHELIEKLLYRYDLFSQHENTKRRKLAASAFSLLIRVVDEMCTDINNAILGVLTDTVHRLLNEGALVLAKILRRKIVEKVEQKRQLAENSPHHKTLWEASHMTTKQYSLLDFHARHIAEQMTLLDAELFQKIEIPEVLLWPQYQNEEMSPNLTAFTVHFNDMSYWCRTLILSQEDAKDREKILLKFIKILKHLRRHNNFNSYLALLSAVDSAPIRRLDWHKQNAEAVTEFCTLIDSSSSFRAYRQALAEAEPPCIPYIGIILQDLTFVHIGNNNELEDGSVNFSKRWQQFHILDNMKRFKKCNYEFKKDHKILAFFDNFENSLSEESLWQISEDIKPRGGKKKHK